MNKFATASGLLVVLVGLVVAYDFQDEAFNQVLARDLEELSSDEVAPHYRARRDEEAVNGGDKCRRRRFKGCCGDDLLENLYEKDRPLKKECYKTVVGKDYPSPSDPFKCDKTDRHRKNMTCVLKCLFEKKNLVDAEGNIIVAEFNSQVKNFFGKEAWWTAALEDAIGKCIVEANKAAAERDTKDPESCNPASIKVAHCLFKEIQLSCPADQIKDEKACTKLREKLQKNEFFAPPPPSIEDE